jgi:hypothetical protein
MELLVWINCILKIKISWDDCRTVDRCCLMAWPWDCYILPLSLTFVCVCVRACPQSLSAGFVVSVTYLWSGVMVQRSCRGSWTTWAVSIRMSSSPWTPREAATLPCRAQTYVGDWMAHWAMKFTVNPPTVTCARSHHQSPLFQAAGYPHHLSAHCHRFVLVMEPAWWVGMLQVHFKGKVLKKTLWHTCVFGNTSFFIFQATATHDILSDSHITDAAQSNGCRNGRAADYYIKASTADLHLRSATSVKQ